MKFHKILLFSMVFALMTGCSQNMPEESLPDIDSLRQESQSTTDTELSTEAVAPMKIYYLNGHESIPSEQLSKFRAKLETENFQWNECEISEIPADAEILIFNAPQEDITTEEFQILSEYFQHGGDMMLFLPASESETRYKFLNNLLETFSIQIDYDKITETDKFRMQEDESIRLNIISEPDRMTDHVDTMQSSPVYMKNMRSFHLLGDYATDELFVDVMLQTADTVVGEPCGGTEDDPLTYEQEKLDILVYSLDTIRNNASVIVCGASDFLLDENFESKNSEMAKEWIYSSCNWFKNYSSYQ